MQFWKFIFHLDGEIDTRLVVIYNNTLMEENYERGIEQGIQQGKSERDAELIQRMRSKGMSDEDIGQILGYKI